MKRGTVVAPRGILIRLVFNKRGSPCKSQHDMPGHEGLLMHGAVTGTFWSHYIEFHEEPQPNVVRSSIVSSVVVVDRAGDFHLSNGGFLSPMTLKFQFTGRTGHEYPCPMNRSRRKGMDTDGSTVSAGEVSEPTHLDRGYISQCFASSVDNNPVR